MHLVPRIMDVYSKIDQQVVAFQLKSGLRCPSGCGLCCSADVVQTTVIEMLPAAHEILCRGESALWMERIRLEGSSEGVCVLYQKQCTADTPGHCSLYALRPAVCRLFGFATVRDRLGAFKLAACKHLKNTDPGSVDQARSHQEDAPCFTHFGTMLLALDVIGTHLMPINMALYQAIMRLGLAMQMTHGEALGTTSAA